MQTMRCGSCGARLGENASCPAHPVGSVVQSKGVEDVDIPPVAVEGYHLGPVLGHGSLGVVYAACPSNYSNADASSYPYALKCTRPGDVEGASRLKQEALYLRRAGGKVTMRLLDEGVLPEGRAWFVMPRVTGLNLAQQLAHHVGPRPVDKCLPIVTAISRALSHLHGHGIVHRDLSPENIVVDVVGSKTRALLLDLGSALDVGAPVPAGRRAEGTPLYMAPERFADDLGAHVTSDLYALSAIFYEMLAGRPPFWGTPQEVEQCQLERLVAPIPEAGRALDQLFRALLNKRHERRPKDARTWRQALPKDPTPVAERSDETDSSSIALVAASPSMARLPVLFLRPPSNVAPPVHWGSVLGGVEGITAVGLGQTVVFGIHAQDSDPLLTALAAAAHVLAKGLATAVHVDICELQVRGQGNRTRAASPALSDPIRFPLDTPAARGAWISQSVRDARPDLVWESEHGGFFKLAVGTDGNDWTTHVEGDQLLGRHAAQARLTLMLEQGLRMRGPVAVRMLGEKGVGKSAVGHWLDRAAQDHGASVIRIRPVLDTRATSNAATIQLTCALVALGFDPQLSSDPLAWSLAAGKIEADDPAVRDSAAAPGALRNRTVRALAHGLRVCAEKRALVVIVDDADRVDDVCLAAIDAPTAVAGLPLVVVFVAAPSLATTRPLLGTVAPLQTHELLEPLDAADSEALLRNLLRDVEHAPSKVMKQIAARGEGNPQLLHEMVKGLRAQGAVKRDGRHAWLDTQLVAKLPASLSLNWLCKHQLSSLRKDLLPVAQMLATWGPDLFANHLEALVETAFELGVPLGTDVDPLQAVKHLCAHHITSQGRDGCIRFRLEGLAHIVVNETLESRRKALHAVAQRLWDNPASAPDNVRLPKLAIAAQACGDVTKAAAIAWRLATEASSKHDHLQAERWYHMALDCFLAAADSTMCCRAYFGRAFARLGLGRQEDALLDLNAALQSSMNAPEQLVAELHLERAMILDWLNDYPAAAAATNDATACVRDATDLPVLLSARLSLAQGRTLYRNGDFKPGVAQMRAAEQAAHQAGEAGYTTRMAANLLIAPALVQLDAIDEAATLFEKVIRESLARGDDLHRSAALFNRAVLRVGQADFVGALNDMTAVTALTRSAGLGFLLRDTEMNCAEIAHLGRDSPLARYHLARYVDLLDRLPGVSLRERALAPLLAARIALFDKEFSEATTALNQLHALGVQTAQGTTGLSATEQLLAETLGWALAPAGKDVGAALDRESEFTLPAERAELRAIVAIGYARAGLAVAFNGTLSLLHSDKNPAVAAMRNAVQQFADEKWCLSLKQ